MWKLGRPDLLLLTLVLVSLATTALALVALKAPPGFYIELRLRSPTDETGLLARRDVVWCLFIDAIAPASMGGDTVELLYSCYRGRGAAYINHQQLRRIAEGWVNLVESRGGDPEAFTTALIARAYVSNASNGQLLYHGTTTIEYKPSELLKPKAYRYLLHLVRDEPVPLVSRETLHLQPVLAERIKPQPAEGAASVEPLYASWYEHHARAVVRVENLTSTLPASYFRNASGVTYIKIPILILNNPSSQAP